MKNALESIYEKLLLSEAEKSHLQNPSKDTVGTIKTNQDLFGQKPKTVEGPDKAKLVQGPSSKEGNVPTKATGVKKASGGGFKGTSPAQDGKEDAEDPTELEGEDVYPETEEDEADKEKKPKNENFTMNAFETLFKKTLNEELAEEELGPEETEANSEDRDESMDDGMDEGMDASPDEETDDDGDLITDLKSLADRLASIISKIEGMAEDEGEGEPSGEYTDEDFADEFGGEEEEEEEAPMKESVDKPKALGDRKKKLQGKSNKVGKLHPKGGKAKSDAGKTEPKPKALGDKKKTLQSHNNKVSSLKPGDFFQ